MSNKEIISIDQMPVFLSVQDIADITGLCLSKSYELCRSKGFPSVIIGRRIIIPKTGFMTWMQDPKAGAR